MTEGRFFGRDEEFMRLALGEAEVAGGHGDVPIGAVVVRDGEVIGSAGNERELRSDPTAHAEVLALREAAERLGGWRSPGSTTALRSTGGCSRRSPRPCSAGSSRSGGTRAVRRLRTREPGRIADRIWLGGRRRRGRRLACRRR